VESLIYKEDADRIDSIHTLNAQYIIDILPDRLYSHMMRGDMLRVSTRLLSNDASWRVALLGFCHQVAWGWEVNVWTYILHEDGRIYAYDAEHGRQSYGITYLHRNMLMQWVDLDPWKIQRNSNHGWVSIGLHLEDVATAHDRYFWVVMENVRASFHQVL
jgi:hypothetical protein